MSPYVPFKLPSFEGKHNRSKALVLLYMSQDIDTGYTVNHLARVLGISSVSLSALLGRWTKWRLVERRQLTTRGRPCVYHLTTKGAEWLERNRPFMPIERYNRELAEYRAKRDRFRVSKRSARIE